MERIAPAGHVIGDTPEQVWGMTSAERLRRSLSRLGAAADAPSPTAVLLRAGYVLEERLVKALLQRPGVALIDAAGQPVGAHVPAEAAATVGAALATGALPDDFRGERLTAVALAGDYNAALRKRESPLLERLTAETRAPVEKRLFDGSYKGVTDLVTKYLWPAPALAVTRLCAAVGVTPNQVTFDRPRAGLRRASACSGPASSAGAWWRPGS